MFYHFGMNRFLTEMEFRTHFYNCSFPEIITKEVAEFFDTVPVLPSPKPDADENQIVVLIGVKQDRLGNWVEDWAVKDKDNLSIF